MRWWRGRDRLAEVSQTLRGKDRRALMASIGAGAVAAATEAWAQQPSTVSSMPYASTPLSGGELTYIVQSGVSKKTPVSGLGIQQLSGLTDVSVTEPSTNGYVLTWSSALAKWISAAVGGGGNGLSTVTSKASIGNTNPALGSVQLTLAGAVGLFNWVAGSHTSQVTSDPYQGIYVALTSDPTGATGAWVRSFTDSINLGWFTGIDVTGVGDSTLPFQSAVNLAVTLHVKLLIPPTFPKILITASITYSGSLCMEGVAGFLYTLIAANFAGPMFYRNGTLVTRTGIVGVLQPGVIIGMVIRDITFNNVDYNQNASCFQVYNVQWPLLFDSCYFAGYNRGLELCQSFGAVVVGCNFAGAWFVNPANPISTVPYNNSVGLLVCDAAGGTVVGNTFKNYGVGIRAAGTAAGFIGGNDIEVNGIGLSVGGVSENGATFGSVLPFSGLIDGNYFESNYRMIDVYGLSSGTVSNSRCAANGGSPAQFDPSIGNGFSQTGLTLFIGGAVANIENININGYYTSWAINYGGYAGYYNLKNVYGANNIANTPVVCNATTGVVTTSATASSIACQENLGINDRAVPTDTSDQLMSVSTKLALMGFTQPNFTRAQVYPNNLMGQVSVAGGASTAAVTFLPQITGGSAIINTIGASGSGNTLPAATYYYAVTLVGPNGETGVNLASTNTNFELQAVATGQEVTITFFGVGSGAKYLRRIYRFLQISGAPAVVSQGFFEIAGNVNTFIDTGQAFTGHGMPPPNTAIIPSQVEKDNNYVILSVGGMNWSHGGWWITSQSTAGFTINFANANSGSATPVTWLIGRP